MEYKSIYSFEVTEKIYNGKQVFVVDKKDCKVYSVNDMSVSEFMQLIKGEGKTNRYAFWYEEVTEDAEL